MAERHKRQKREEEEPPWVDAPTVGVGAKITVRFTFLLIDLNLHLIKIRRTFRSSTLLHRITSLSLGGVAIHKIHFATEQYKRARCIRSK